MHCRNEEVNDHQNVSIKTLLDLLKKTEEEKNNLLADKNKFLQENQQLIERNEQLIIQNEQL